MTPTRILFITEDDPLYVRRFFDVFLAEYDPAELEIVGITVMNAFKESLVATGKRVLRFYGRDFPRLLASFAAAKARREGIPRLARDAGVPFLDTASVNDPAYLERLRALDLDVIVSVAAPEIFKPPILEIPRLGCVNIHSGRLPVYRGMMPVFWQMQKGEPHVTISIHEMVPALDAGPVLGTAEVPIAERDSLHRVMVEAKHVGARLMIDVLRTLAAGTAQPQPVDMDGASYFSFPQPPDVAVLRGRGHGMF